jgi:hypothetical protein
MKLAVTLRRDYTKKPHFARQKAGEAAQIPGTVGYRQVPADGEGSARDWPGA